MIFRVRHLRKRLSPLALALFDCFDFVEGVFIMNNFVSVTKDEQTDWFEVTSELRTFLQQYLSDEDNLIVNEAAIEALQDSGNNDYNPNLVLESDTDVVKKIKELLTKYIQPAVEQDGGSIVFRSYKDGIVTLGMQGACSGCPSSTITLKTGIENLLTRMVPEVVSVEAEAM